MIYAVIFVRELLNVTGSIMITKFNVKKNELIYAASLLLKEATLIKAKPQLASFENNHSEI